jgi:hypothetical protein
MYRCYDIIMYASHKQRVIFSVAVLDTQLEFTRLFQANDITKVIVLA